MKIKKVKEYTFFNLPQNEDHYNEFIQNFRHLYIKNCMSLTDNDWCNQIYYFVFKFYNDNAQIIKDIENLDEKAIKGLMKNWLMNDEEFSDKGFIINREPLSENTSIIGYDDIKFQHSFWRNKYFVFECKILNNSTSSINNYIYTKIQRNGTVDEDGGVYRFLINKYAANLYYGGLIGFIKSGDIFSIMERIKEQIKDLVITSDSGLNFGQIIDSNLLDCKIENNNRTFYSNHCRIDKSLNVIIEPIKLTHIFFDFVY
ncbi:MAG: hypothetical protein EPN82_05755 [Bacteroidetes bacterium]|nr:MAG: hypothetical protein EPN82_05755 [Bacteroidota bacterium]